MNWPMAHRVKRRATPVLQYDETDLEFLKVHVATIKREIVGVAAWDATLPAARELPAAGTALDVLALAPLTEEIFFRGWLLAAAQSAGISAPLRVALSACGFALWHVGAGDSPLFFAALGAYLAVLFERSGGALSLCVGTHATYNLCVVLLRAARV